MRGAVRTLLRPLQEMIAGLDAAARVWHGIPIPDDHRARWRTKPHGCGSVSKVTLVETLPSRLPRSRREVSRNERAVEGTSTRSSPGTKS